MRPFVEAWEDLVPAILAPLRPNRHPLLMARFGIQALRSATGLAGSRLDGPEARALFAGMAGHSILPLEAYGTASFGLMLGVLAHAVGWPVAAGGSGKIAEALGSHFETLGGQIETGVEIRDLEQIPPADAVLLDVTPRQLLKLAGDRLPQGYARRMGGYRYGPGVFKIDWALEGAIPWANPQVAGAGTVHVGGALEEIAASERSVWAGEHPEQPFVLLAQPSLFDPARAPQGKHTAWAYCHVPHGSTKNMTRRIESQIERFAPGFRDLILARHTFTTQQIEDYNPNYVGGDINGGVQDLRQNIFRPIPARSPYATPLDGVFICSSATPPGGGVHGMCGYHAAQAALRSTLKG